MRVFPAEYRHRGKTDYDRQMRLALRARSVGAVYTMVFENRTICV